jgi:hypothetical protein
MDDGGELAEELTGGRRRRERADVPADAEVRALGADQRAADAIVDQPNGVPQLARRRQVEGVRLTRTVERDRQ